MYLICQRCERSFEGNDRAKYKARYCPGCARERKREVQRGLYKYAPREVGYVLVADPSDYPLEPGLRISKEEHDWMVKFGSYVPGTILEQRGERFEVRKVNGKWKTVPLASAPQT
jgi:hypothetical protein